MFQGSSKYPGQYLITHPRMDVGSLDNKREFSIREIELLPHRMDTSFFRIQGRTSVTIKERAFYHTRKGKQGHLDSRGPKTAFKPHHNRPFPTQESPDHAFRAISVSRFAVVQFFNRSQSKRTARSPSSKAQFVCLIRNDWSTQLQELLLRSNRVTNTPATPISSSIFDLKGDIVSHSHPLILVLYLQV